MITLIQYPNQIANSGPNYNIAIRHARKIAGKKNFRCPHHTTSLLGLLGELAVSVGGVLYLEDFQEFNRSSIASLFSIWILMDPEHRPHIIIKAQTGMVDNSGSRYANVKWHQLGPVELYEIIPQVDEHIIVNSLPSVAPSAQMK
jgi:hypothetical protein